MAGKLTAKQKAFCENYVSNGYKLVKAYMDAFGSSYEVANAEQWKLMKKEPIKTYIKELQKERFEALGVSAERIAQELSKMAFAELDENNTTTSKARALELLQKQMGLQTQKVEADIKTTTINIDLEDERAD